MENPLSNEVLPENISEIKTPELVCVPEEEKGIINPYPKIRHIFLIILVLITVATILFLVYQNGKSIYDKGI